MPRCGEHSFFVEAHELAPRRERTGAYEGNPPVHHVDALLLSRLDGDGNREAVVPPVASTNRQAAIGSPC